MQAFATGDSRASPDGDAGDENGAAMQIIGNSAQAAMIMAMLRSIAHRALLAGLVMR